VLDIPKDKNCPVNSVQCDICGGGGCGVCGDKGWLTPRDHPNGRRCMSKSCEQPLPPNHEAVYCTNQCAFNDA